MSYMNYRPVFSKKKTSSDFSRDNTNNADVVMVHVTLIGYN